jgi:glycosyltransferase involved in cell wall biosynthesis
MDFGPPAWRYTRALMRSVSIVTPCYNEEENVDELHSRIAAVFAALPQYRYEHLFIDNASTDTTELRIRAIAARDPNVRAIFNARNFGHLRSPFHAMLQARGDAVITLASDLQDPPELIADFLAAWERGAKVVIGVKKKSEESLPFWLLRSAYYKLVRAMADVDLIEHFTGFGLYDRQVIEILRDMRDPYPYVRGLVSEIGFPPARIPYDQPLRKRGITKNNFYTLWDIAMLGMTTHTKVPLRVATIGGFLAGALSFGIAFGYLLAKLIWWDEFQLGAAPLLIGMFFLGSVQLLTLGILGEYVGAVLTQVRGLPHVVERERIDGGSVIP